MMGMHVTVDVRDGDETVCCQHVFDYLEYVDQTFSTYKENSEISKINRGEILRSDFSADMVEIFDLAEKTKIETRGYFDIKKPDGSIDPSGIVKGWAIWKASELLKKEGHEYFFIDVGGDIQGAVAANADNIWRVGIRNPFKHEEIIKVLSIQNEGIATSGTYERGAHIYNPHDPSEKQSQIVSLTVIGPNIYEADRFATAAFAMGVDGITFIEQLVGFEGYMINAEGIATMTSGLKKYTT